jgi:hypothetical protein
LKRTRKQACRYQQRVRQCLRRKSTDYDWHSVVLLTSICHTVPSAQC